MTASDAHSMPADDHFIDMLDAFSEASFEKQSMKKVTKNTVETKQ